MPKAVKSQEPRAAYRVDHQHLDMLLDEGLKETFPASDPVAISVGRSFPAAPRDIISGGELPAGNSDPVTDLPWRTPMESRMNYWKAAPDGVALFRNFNTYVENSGIEQSLLELVKTRTSQINGCAYCLDMHTKDARRAGETEQRLYTLSAWRETSFFSERERAALAWTEAVTRIPDGPIDDELYDALRAQFSDKEIVDLTLAVIAINGWNRLAIPFRTPAGSYHPHERDGHRNQKS
jgi:AhpD family alkylhydroperoxidase